MTEPTTTEAYEGELAMYRQLVRTLRVVVRPDDADVAEVRRLLWQHVADDAAARTEGKSSPTGADATPDFFQPGRTYQHSQWTFRCDAITTDPNASERTALGWFRFSRGDWSLLALTDQEWAEGWTDVTEGGESR